MHEQIKYDHFLQQVTQVETPTSPNVRLLPLDRLQLVATLLPWDHHNLGTTPVAQQQPELLHSYSHDHAHLLRQLRHVVTSHQKETHVTCSKTSYPTTVTSGPLLPSFSPATPTTT